MKLHIKKLFSMLHIYYVFVDAYKLKIVKIIVIKY